MVVGDGIIGSGADSTAGMRVLLSLQRQGGGSIQTAVC